MQSKNDDDFSNINFKKIPPKKKTYNEIPLPNNDLVSSNIFDKKNFLDRSNTNNYNLDFNKNENENENEKFGLRVCKTFEQKKNPSENPINLGNVNNISLNNKSFNYDMDLENQFKRRLSTKFTKFDLPKNHFKHKIKEFLNSNKCLVIMTIASVYALILSDLNTIFFSKGAIDIVFSILSSIVFILFLMEFSLSLIVRDNYIFTFFFWMDFISMLSILVNIEWIVFPAMNLISTDNIISSYISPSVYKILKNFSGALRTTRVTRLLNIIKFIRLIRLFRLYKNTILKKRKKYLKDRSKKIRSSLSSKSECIENGENNGENKAENDSAYNLIKNKENFNLENFSFGHSDEINELMDKPYEEILSESKISEKLSYSMTKNLIILIFLLLLIFLFLNPYLFDDTDLINYNILLGYLHNFFHIYETENLETNLLIENFLKNCTDKNYPIINVTNNGKIIYEDLIYKNYTFRSDEINYIFNDLNETVIAYSIIFDNTLYSILNLIRMLYIAFILGLMIVKLDEDSKTHALYPLENIMHMIQKISNDPIGSNDLQKINKLNSRENHNIGDLNKELSDIEKSEWWKMLSKSNYEVNMIEAAIIKISALLAIGFGEAGEPIIKHNLKHRTQQVDPMVKGRKKIAIFGFCSIRDFPMVNECLQERTMSFINQIANIVHTSVDLYTGAINKNIGDSFLCVWKFSNYSTSTQKKFVVKENNFIANGAHGIVEECKLEEKKSDEIKSLALSKKRIVKRSTIIKNGCKTNINKNEAADRALLGYLNILIWINKKKNMLMYSHDKDILKVIPNYKVKMGFGLHVGWAIEGSIGSNHKIDASYLSPNVNITARLEAATKQYDVNILISGELYDLFSFELKELCRLIDIVTVKGSKNPLKLYTVDTNLDLIPSEKDQPNINISENRRKYEEKKQRFNKNIEEYGSTFNYILQKSSFKELLNLKRDSLFTRNFSEGIYQYISGNWKKAKNLLNQALNIDPFDGPTKIILEFIGKYNYKKPSDWKGYRSLNSK